MKLNGYLQQGFTDDNKLVMEVRDQIAAATKIKSELETNYPALAKMDLAEPDSTTGPTNAPSAQARGATPDSSDYLKSNLEYISLPARIKTLQAQLSGKFQSRRRTNWVRRKPKFPILNAGSNFKRTL